MLVRLPIIVRQLEYLGSYARPMSNVGGDDGDGAVQEMISLEGGFYMSSTVGFIKGVSIRTVWPKEDADFTPWLAENISELDNVLGLGLTNPQREVGAGDFSIDLLAETNFGDIVIENQFGRSDHRHLGQLVTYMSQQGVERAIWIAEEARPEHVTAVERLNERGIGQIWMVTARTIQIDDSLPAPLFTVVAEPADIEKAIESKEFTPSQVKTREFLTALFAQAHEKEIDSPFKKLKPTDRMLSTYAKGKGLVYRLAVNRQAARVLITNTTIKGKGKWLGALGELSKNRQKIDEDFAKANLKQRLEWVNGVKKDRWWIRYKVDVNYQGKPDQVKMLELNRAAAEMKRVFDPYIEQLDPKLEEDMLEPLVE